MNSDNKDILSTQIYYISILINIIYTQLANNFEMRHNLYHKLQTHKRFNQYEFIKDKIVQTYLSSNLINPNAHMLLKLLNQKRIHLPFQEGGNMIEFLEIICLSQEYLSKKFQQEEDKQFYALKDEKMNIQTATLFQEIIDILKYTSVDSKGANNVQTTQQFLRKPLFLGAVGKVFALCFLKGKRISIIISFDRLKGRVLVDSKLIQQGKIRKQRRDQRKKIKKNSYLQKLIKNNMKIQQKMQVDQISIGSTYQSQGSNYLSYFSTSQIEKNILKKFNKMAKIINHFWLKKPTGNSTKHTIELISLFFNRKAVKIQFNLQDIQEVIVYKNGTNGGCIYFKLNINPKYYINIMELQYSFAPYYIKQWHRVQNFPLFYSESNQKHANQILNIYLRSQTTICIQISKGKQRFQSLLKKIQQIAGSEDVFVFKYMQEPKDLVRVSEPYELSTLIDSEIFMKLLTKADQEKQGSVFQIKFALASLLESKSVRYEQIIDVLLHLQSNPEDIEKFQVYLTNVSHLNVKQKLTYFVNHIQNQIRKKQIKYKQQQSDSDQFQRNEKKSMINNEVNNTHVKIANVKVTPSGIKFSEHTTQQRNRVLKQFAGFEHQFLKIQVCDENGYKIPSSEYLSNNFIRKTINQIPIFGRKYIPLAWSQSQLRGRSMWYICQNLKEKHISRQQILQFLGNFDGIRNPALRAARMGQNMAAAWSFNCLGINCRVQDDIFPINQKKLMYSDGIGRISLDLIKQIELEKNSNDLCAIQVRYKGAKGILAVDPRLQNRTIVLRKSMVKYACQHQDALKYLDILQENKYKVGYLNRQTIILFYSRGVPDKVFFSLQDQYVREIQQFDQENKQQHDYFKKGIQNYFTFSKEDSIRQVFMAACKLSDVNSYNQPYFSGIVQAIKERSLQLLKSKAHIKVKNSARLLGVLDQLKVLGENQVYCTIKKTNEHDRENIKGLVCLCKNPCLLKSDVRVVRCVSDEQIDQRCKQKGISNYLKKLFVNVIVFPQAGKKPLTSLISGSDLDGDQFFISWQRELTYLKPLTSSEQNRTQQEMNPLQNQLNREPTYDDILDFFVEFINSDSLGKLSNSHLVHADQNNGDVDCEQCHKLAEIHGVAVDYPKKGYKFNLPKQLLVKHYPHFMEKAYPTVSYTSQSILGKLYEKCILMKSEYSMSQSYQDNRYKNYFLSNQVLEQYQYSFQEAESARKLVNQYHNQIIGILEYFKLKNQFQVYIGKHIDEKNNRTVQVVAHLKNSYVKKFFDRLPESKKYKGDINRFTLADLKNGKDILVNYEVERKLVLWYATSHFLDKGGRIPISEKKKKQPFYYINSLSQKQNYINSLSQKQKQAHCLGITWFCLPKLMVWLFKNKVRKNRRIQKNK